MAFLVQVLDILVAGIIAGIVAVALGTVTGTDQFGVTIGVILASMYYFSRNPWGATWDQAAAMNDRIDELYDSLLPR